MVTNNVESLVTGPMFKLSALLLQHPQYQLKSMSLENNIRGEIGGNVAPTIGVVQAQAPTGAGGFFGAAPGAGNLSQGRAAAPVSSSTPTMIVTPSAPRSSGTVAPSAPAAVATRPTTVLAPPSGPGSPMSNNFTGPTATTVKIELVQTK
jgi:hypothetical protein